MGCRRCSSPTPRPRWMIRSRAPRYAAEIGVAAYWGGLDTDELDRSLLELLDEAARDRMALRAREHSFETAQAPRPSWSSPRRCGAGPGRRAASLGEADRSAWAGYGAGAINRTPAWALPDRATARLRGAAQRAYVLRSPKSRASTGQGGGSSAGSTPSTTPSAPPSVSSPLSLRRSAAGAGWIPLGSWSSRTVTPSPSSAIMVLASNSCLREGTGRRRGCPATTSLSSSAGSPRSRTPTGPSSFRRWAYIKPDWVRIDTEPGRRG